MQTLTSTGTGDTPQTALLNAMGGMVSAINDAEQFLIVSQTLEDTPNGFVMAIRVVVLDEDDLKSASELKEKEEGGGDKSLVFKKDEEHDVIALAYFLSRKELERDRKAVKDVTKRDNPNPGKEIIDNPLPIDFQEAVQVVDDNPHDNDNWTEVSMQIEKKEEDTKHITTQLSNQEIDDAVSHEMLSGDVVDWEKGNAALAAGPAAPVFEKDSEQQAEFEEVVTEEGKLVRRPKSPPPAPDTLDLAV